MAKFPPQNTNLKKSCNPKWKIVHSKVVGTKKILRFIYFWINFIVMLMFKDLCENIFQKWQFYFCLQVSRNPRALDNAVPSLPQNPRAVVVSAASPSALTAATSRQASLPDRDTTEPVVAVELRMHHLLQEGLTLWFLHFAERGGGRFDPGTSGTGVRCRQVSVLQTPLH